MDETIILNGKVITSQNTITQLCRLGILLKVKGIYNGDITIKYIVNPMFNIEVKYDK